MTGIICCICKKQIKTDFYQDVSGGIYCETHADQPEMIKQSVMK